MTPPSPIRCKGKPVRASGNIFSIPKKLSTDSFLYLGVSILDLEGKPKRSPETLPQVPDSLDRLYRLPYSVR